MKGIYIQVHIDKKPELDLNFIEQTMEQVAQDSRVDHFEVENPESGLIRNYTFGTAEAHSIWESIRSSLFRNGILSDCAIAMCSSDEGWDRFALLHHFDPKEPLQNIESLDMVKIQIRTEDENGNVDVETPWATSVGDDKYRLENCPFIAYGVSWQDIVEAKPHDDGLPMPIFSKVLQESGNKTIRIIFDPPLEEGNQSSAALSQIVEKGCSYEGLNPAYVVVNIPPDVDFDGFIEYMNDTDLQWELADPPYAELYPGFPIISSYRLFIACRLAMKLEIRRIQPSDTPIIALAFAELGWDKPVEQYERYLKEQEKGSREVLIATVGNEFAAYVTVIWASVYEPFREAAIPEIQDFNVLPKYRRKGIGTALMDRAEELVAQRSDIVGIGVAMYSDYGNAQRMYVKRGYVPDGRGVTYKGEVLTFGESAVNDDDLVLYFTKRLLQ